MKPFGILLIILGAATGFLALSMDVSVSAGVFGRVANTSLIAERQTYLIIAGVLVIAGVVLFGFGSVGSSSQSTQNASVLRAHPADTVCGHCGVTLRLDPQELEGGKYVCPECNNTSSLSPTAQPSVRAGPEPGEKECPMCAETVKYRAKLCRFCNHEFEATSIAA